MRRAALVVVFVMAAGLVLAGPVAATTGHVNWITNGEGATATWTNVPAEPVDGVTYTDTFLAVFHEVLSPRARGHTEGAFFLQSTYHFEGSDIVWDSNAFAFFDVASVLIRQPLSAATAAGEATLTTCVFVTDTCTDSTISFEAEWTGDGAMVRAPKLPEVTVTPTMTVYLTFGNGDTFVRPATAVATFEPATLLPAGSYLVPTSAEREGTKMFVAHFATISICHDGTPDPNTGECIPNE